MFYNKKNIISNRTFNLSFLIAIYLLVVFYDFSQDL